MNNKLKLARVSGEFSSFVFSFVVLIIITFFVLQEDYYLAFFAVVFQLVYVLAVQRQLMGNSLLTSDEQFGDIHKIAKENADALGISMPKIYISQDPYINAYTIGFKKPFAIVLSSNLVESFTRDEIDFVLGHEMGHVLFGHSKLLSLISPIGKDLPFVSWIYGGWQRKTEYTSDRVGLVLTNKIRPAISVILKMSVGSKLAKLVDVDEVIEQIGEGRKGFMSKVGEFMLTHPYSTNRIRALVEFWHFSGLFVETKDESSNFDLDLEDLKKYKKMKDEGLLSDKEFAQLKKEILKI